LALGIIAGCEGGDPIGEQAEGADEGDGSENITVTRLNILLLFAGTIMLTISG